jgi:UDP-2,4-diacetamido-2,4,6-trideoxy-beta-L-altropyranose hydrolase
MHSSWLASSQEDDAKETIRAIGKNKIEWLIIDHYAIDKTWQNQLRPFTKKIMVIDDLADRHHECDLLLDQNLVFNFRKRYKNLLPKKCNLLLGPRYALLDPLYSKFHKKKLNRIGKIKRVLIFFGGADQKNLTGLSISTLLKFKKNKILFDIVISKQSIFYSQIKKISKKNKNIILHDTLPSLAPLIYKSDLAIGAAGSNTWERCCLALPSIIVISGFNQKKIAYAMKKAGVAIVLKESSKVKKEIKTAFSLLLNDTKLYLKMSKKAFSICDGEGINKVVKKLL